jgi:hypothetical protein
MIPDLKHANKNIKCTNELGKEIINLDFNFSFSAIKKLEALEIYLSNSL